MNVLTSSEHLGEALVRAQRHWQARLKAAAIRRPQQEPELPTAPTIAMAREEGAGGTALARKLAEKLGWQVYDHELLQRIADEMGLQRELLESIDEHGQSWLLTYFEAFASDHAPTEGAYFYQLAKVLLALAAHGECIIVGRGAALFLPRDMTLRVRVVAPYDFRVATVQERFHLTHQQATRRVEDTDLARDRFLQQHFHKDPTDPANYDIIVNTARFGIDRSADLVVEALRKLPLPQTAKVPTE